MAIAAVMVVTVFNGANISTWTNWVWFALGIEILIIWVYTVSRLRTFRFTILSKVKTDFVSW